LVGTAGSCTDYNFSQQTRQDTFQQERRNTVDILLVVDNSCSMVEEQEKLATNFDSFINAFSNIDVDYRIGVITTDTNSETFKGRLVGGSDEIELQNSSGKTIDRVAWDIDWPVETGVALQLDPSVTTSTGNDSMDAWCAATAVYQETDLGTPGAANSDCGEEDTGSRGQTQKGEQGQGEGEGSETTLSEPASPSDVLITEFMADPADIDDSQGEWVELFNNTEDELSLAGCVLIDDGRNSFTFPDGVTLAAGAYLTVGRSDQAAAGAATVVTGEALTLNNADLYLTPDTEDASEIFAENVAVGISGVGIEMGLEAARLAFTEPLLSEYNQSFLRDDANLSLIFVSDENDSSAWPADDYLSFYTELKGQEAYRDHSLMRVSAVIGKTKPTITGDYACESENGFAWYGSRYVSLVERTEGALESICDDDFSPIAEQLGLTVSGLDVEFALSAWPDESTLTVALYESAEEDGWVRDLVKDEDYSYQPENNTLRFVDEQVPPSEYWVVAEYTVLAVGASPGSTQDTGASDE